MSEKADIVVVVVSRDMEALLEVCLRHVARALAEPAPRIVVVDNASSIPYQPDEMDAPAFDVIRYDRHHGFAACCNAAVAAGPAEYYLLLNNDVLLHEQAITNMLEAFHEHAALGIVGTRMVFPDNTIQHAGVVFGPGDQGPYHVDRGRYTRVVSRAFRRCQAVTGACMLVRHETWKQLDGLDEAYAFGLEDIDFCLCVGRQGGLCGCSQAVDSLHFESMTPGRVELDIPSRKHFMEQWKGRYAIDG